MILSFVIVWVLVVNCCFSGINEWLPEYVPHQNFWLVDILYRFIRIIGASCLMYPITTLSLYQPSILISCSCFLFAFAIKKLARHLEYKERL